MPSLFTRTTYNAEVETPHVNMISLRHCDAQQGGG